jgi:hypothetical protein
MSDQSQANLAFLPWVRQGAAAAITSPDSLGAAQPGAAGLDVTLSVNGAAIVPPTRITLRGPADVVGIDAHQVVRTEPRADTRDFESNFFPSIEFDRPDFPWLFTPAAANADGKLRPWLCLVVVRKQDGVQIDSTVGAPLPTLTITAPAKHFVELPDLKDSWGWAHAQAASGDMSEAAMRGALDGAPELSLSRLVCPRLLVADTDYIACVVPTFELGRKAGLGLPIADADLTAANALAPAWTVTPVSPPPTLQLPVYYTWQFHSGPGGDFAALAGKLTHVIPDGLGQRTVDIRRPGFDWPADASTQPGANVTMQLEGALQSLSTSAPPVLWSDASAPSFEKALADIVNQPALRLRDQPLLAPPLYGRWYAGKNAAVPGAANWFDELNVDPRWRVAAGIGTRVVQKHQEALMASAWDQAAQLQHANRRLRQLQLSMAVNESLYARHLSALVVPATTERMLRFVAPAMGRIRLPADAALSRPAATGLPGAPVAAPLGPTLYAQMANSPLPVTAVGTAMRRIGRQRGPLTRRVAAQNATRSPVFTWVSRLNDGGMSVPNALPSALDYARLPALPSVDSIVSALWNRGFKISPENQPLTPLPSVDLLPAKWDYPGYFRAAAAEHLSRIRPPLAVVNRPHLTLSQAADVVLTQMRPRVALAQLARAAIATGSNALPPTAAGVQPVGVETVMMAPSFPQPMYEPLKEMSQDLLLPGLDKVKPETVLGLRSNRAFVEAYMIGLNVEMGHELLWRGFPTDQQGTYFKNFWGQDAGNAARADIGDLRNQLGRTLGAAAPAAPADEFVLLLRSDLLRRYPNALIYLTRSLNSTPPAPEILPIFNGAMEPDVVFFGFPLSSAAVVGTGPGTGYYVVFQEHPTEPRFGMDDGSQPPNLSHLPIGTQRPGGIPPNPQYTWARNAAHIAGLARRQPVRVAIHASHLLSST